MVPDFFGMQAQQRTTPSPPAAPQVQGPPSREQLQQIIEDAMAAARASAENARAERAIQPPAIPPFPDQGPPESVMILVIVLAALTAATLIFRPLFKALGSRLERRRDPPSELPEVAPRLDRIEQAIEAIAVEVERISEGQRYVTKQMHELRALPAPNPLAQPALSQRAPEPVRRSEP